MDVFIEKVLGLFFEKRKPSKKDKYPYFLFALAILLACRWFFKDFRDYFDYAYFFIMVVSTIYLYSEEKKSKKNHN